MIRVDELFGFPVRDGHGGAVTLGFVIDGPAVIPEGQFSGFRIAAKFYALEHERGKDDLINPCIFHLLQHLLQGLSFFKHIVDPVAFEDMPE